MTGDGQSFEGMFGLNCGPFGKIVLSTQDNRVEHQHASTLHSSFQNSERLLTRKDIRIAAVFAT